ncbi:MAG: HAD-IA family hydrolase [Deltaproteobacteria bacterium]|nr:HAD-IA family hydrolase [Deltaproteobacteria bacterium]
MNEAQVKAHWEDWAARYGAGLRATTRTPSAKRLEIDALVRSLRAMSYSTESRARLLEVGCGNGHNCIALAEAFPGFAITGIDYVERMVEMAEANGRQSAGSDRLSFCKGDVSDLDAVIGLAPLFDVVLSNRCLINLSSTHQQKLALSSLASRLPETGCLLLIENSQQCFERQNRCRETLGLEARKAADFNHFLDEAEVIPHLESLFEEVSIEDFGSLHDLVLYVLVPASNGGVVDYEHPLVEAATRLSLARPEMTGAGDDRVRGLLIDLDGTLADTLPALRSVYAQFLSDHGGVPSDAEFDRLNGIPMPEIIRFLEAEYRLEGSSAELERDYLARVAIACEKAPPSPGARDLLRTAAESGYRIAVVTSGSREAVQIWLERNRLAEFVHTVVGGQDVREGKPSPAPYRLALERIGARARDSLAVEDSKIGARSAVAAGIATYVLARRHAFDEDTWPGVAGCVDCLADVILLL